jgi:hypothetical protein
VSIDDFAAKLAHTPVPWWLARAASWALAGYSIVTGLDYLDTPSTATSARSLTMVVELATLHTWGICFIVAGAVLALGLATGRHSVVWLGHFACAVLYFGFAGATLQAVWEYQHSPLAKVEGDIWRAAYVAFMIAVGHGALCWLRGPIPRRGDEA